MDHGTLALLIPLAPFLLGGLAIWTRHNRKVEEMRVGAAARQSEEEVARQAALTRELEERVKVLERIVTDRGFDVAHQIEALRRDTEQLEDRRAQ